MAAEAYAQAERLISWNAAKLVRNTGVAPIWAQDSGSFQYKRTGDDGCEEWVRIDAKSGARSLVSTPEWPAKEWRDGELPSPDRRFALRLDRHNIVLRDLVHGDERTMTVDGVKHFGWGESPGTNLEPVTQSRSGRTPLPVAAWSPDSKRFAIYRIDERALRDFHFLESSPPDGAALPNLYTVKFATPDDETLASAECFVFDIDSGARLKVEVPEALITRESPIERSQVWWSDDGRALFVLDIERADKAFHVYRADPETGAARKLWSEASGTYVEANMGWSLPIGCVLDRGKRLLLLSERDGWMHLWLHDGETGEPLRQLTRGDWVVREIVRVDERRGRVYFLGGGREPDRDPYLRHLYWVSLDGGAPVLVTPEAADHQVAIAMAPPFLTWRGYPNFNAKSPEGLSPDGSYVVETYSTIATVPRTVLRRTQDGAVICELERADVSALEAAGWIWPEPFCLKAADGKTDIFGALWLPRDYRDDRPTPLLDNIYPGPQTLRTPKSSVSTDIWSMGALATGAALASLGFAVVTIDGAGGPWRSKEFHDISFGRIQRAGGLEDHIAVYRQLAAQRPGLDLDRIGMFGFSGGGTATCRAMFEYPEIFKAGVAAAGSHDLLGYTPYWGEKYQGRYDVERFANARNGDLAERLQGKLLLIAGELDDNCHPAMTMQVARALIKANKDFDLLIMPGHNHMTVGGTGYYTRKIFDFFVRHLLRLEPPAHYALKGPLDDVG